MYQVDFWVPLWDTAGGVNMVASKVAAPIESVFDGKVGKVLVAESDNLSLGDEERKLVLTSVTEPAELHASDLGAGGGRQVLDLASIDEQVLEAGVGTFFVFNMVKVLERRVLLAVVPGWEVV